MLPKLFKAPYQRLGIVPDTVPHPFKVDGCMKNPRMDEGFESGLLCAADSGAQEGCRCAEQDLMELSPCQYWYLLCGGIGRRASF